MAINTTTDFGVYHLADTPDAYQPVRTNNFRFSVTGLNGILRVGDDSEVFDKAEEVLDFSVVKFDAPHFKQDEIPVQRGNSTMYFAGKASFDTGNLVINDFAGAEGKSILEAWQNLSYDVINDIIPSSTVYKRDAIVLEYLPDNTLIRYWELKGCWVKGITETGWDNESSTKKVVTATIRYDRAIPHTSKAEL